MAMAMLLSLAALANDKKYYSKVSAECISGEGKVYVSTSADAPAEADFKDASEASVDGSADATHTYYLHALPAEGKAVKCWKNTDGTEVTGNPAMVTIKGSENSGTPVTASYSVEFMMRPSIEVRSNDALLGSAVIDKMENSLGDVVTVSAKGCTADGLYGYEVRNRHFLFENWTDADGNVVSEEAEYTFTIEKDDVLTANFRLDLDFHGPGYYRVHSFKTQNDQYMLIEGDFKVSLGPRGQYLNGLMSWTGWNQINNSPAGFGKRPSNYLDNPATILYIDGTVGDLSKYGSDDVLMTDCKVSSQGADTYATMSKTFTLSGSSWPGFYRISASSTAELKWNEMDCGVYIGSVMDTYQSWFDFQPVDEAHLDEFYFGAQPSEAMAFDGGYWTSMYTAFPYECRDGVEAYYISALDGEGSGAVAVMSRIESGIVPASTPVLLKCRGLAAGENRLLPLMPDDARIVPLAGENLLKGTFNPYVDANATRNERFDPLTMRVFGENDGKVGFYSLAAGADGTQPLLAVNRAWLDVSSLAAAQGAPLRINVVRDTDYSGVENVSGDVIASGSGDDAVYDLYGRRVATPLPGQIYIVGGKKVLWR